MASLPALAELEDFLKLCAIAGTQRMRETLGKEVAVIADALRPELAELQRLRSLAATSYAAGVLEAAIAPLEAALAKESVPKALAGDDMLPEFCWVPPAGRGAQVPELEGVALDAVEAGLRREEPFVMRRSRLCASAVNRWTLDHLTAHFGDSECVVYEAAQSHFRYWDERKNAAGYPFPSTAHSRRCDMTFKAFSSAVRAERERGDGSRSLYLQTALVEVRPPRASGGG